MSLILSGTNGLSDVDGSAATPAIRGTDTNTGIFFPAADTIAFAEGGVEAMRLDASGNLALGNTSSLSSSANRVDLTINGTSSSMVSFGTGGTRRGYALHDATDFTIASETAGALRFLNNGAERMRLDASGNLLVGSTSTRGSAKLDIRSDTSIALGSNASFYGTIGYSAATGLLSIAAESGGGINFLSGTTERARIDSSGNLLVGTTNSSDIAGVGVKVRQVSSQTQVSSVCSGSLNTYVLYNTTAGAFRFYVSEAGQIFATSTSITAISDQTLKENVRDLETGLTEVMALQPRRFDWKNGDATDVAGFIAQEVEQVLPELVTDYVYNKDEEGNDITKKSLKMGDMLPTLVKAIQEQQALIAQLQADVVALKGNA